MIRTASIYAAAEDNGHDGLRVLITRFYPRGVKRERYDIWVRDLAPSAELLRRYKSSDVGWTDFKSSLLDEFSGNIDSVEAIHALHAQSSTQDIILLCYEKDGVPCHRHMVRDLIEAPAVLRPRHESAVAGHRR